MSDVKSNSTYEAKIVKYIGTVLGWLEVFFLVFKRTRLMLEDIHLILRDEIWPGHQDLKLVKAMEQTINNSLEWR